MRFRIALFAASVALTAGWPLVAHHSFAAEFDGSKAIRLTGALTKIEWTNPHSYFYLDVNESGTIVDTLASMGVQNSKTGKPYSEALAASRERAAVTGALSVHAYDDPRVLAGQGTLGMELEEQLGSMDTILIAVGGGGLIGGVTAWYQSRARIIGVEPELATAFAGYPDEGTLRRV